MNKTAFEMDKLKQKKYSGLIPAKKGDVRNPTGKNQWTTFRELSKKCLTPKDFEDFMDIAKEQARKGNYQFWSDLMDRTFGKATNNMNVSGTVIINIDKDDANL